MIVVDTSAVLAIFLCEPEARDFAEALAKSHDAPVLFKGDDFGQTDLRAAVAVGG